MATYKDERGETVSTAETEKSCKRAPRKRGRAHWENRS